MISFWLVLHILAPLVDDNGRSVWFCAQFVASMSSSPLTTMMAKDTHRFSQVMSHLSVFMCISVPLCVHECVVIFQLCCYSLMTHTVPGSGECHSIVTASLGRLAAATIPAPSKPSMHITLRSTRTEKKTRSYK